jgi:hypothetical protein
MRSASHTLELPADPIRSYFAPWKSKREYIDPVLLKEFERRFQRARRAGNIRMFGLSLPMMAI